MKRATPPEREATELRRKRRRRAVASSGDDDDEPGTEAIALPRFIGDPGADRSTWPKREQHLSKLAGKVKLPASGRATRYRMTDDEKSWAATMRGLYVAETGEQPSRDFFENLYKYGVAAGKLHENCSPEGLRTNARRRKGEGQDAD